MEVSEDLYKNQDICMLHLYHVLQYLEQFRYENGESDIYHILENWVRFYYSREMLCGMCNEKGVAVGYCRDCKKPWFIDHLCLKFHQKISTLEGHRLIDFKSDGRNFRIRDFARRQFCEIHEELEVELHCKTCKIDFCQKCEGEKHEYVHNVHSTNMIYMLLDNIHDTKRQIQGLQTNQSFDQHTCDKLETMINWIDSVLGIEKRYSGIKDVPVPLEIFRLFKHESSTNIVFIKCEAVIKKLANIQGDLCVAFSHQSRQAQRDEDDTIPKVAVNAGDQSLVNCPHSTIYQRRSHAGINSQIVGFTDAGAPDHYNRIRQVVEDEVTPQLEMMDPNVIGNSFLHTRASCDVDGLPNRNLETGADPWVEHARWRPRNASIMQARVVEDEVTDPQLEMDSNVIGNSDLHTKASRDVDGLPNRNLETGANPWIEHARWRPRNASIMQSRVVEDEVTDPQLQMDPNVIGNSDLQTRAQLRRLIEEENTALKAMLTCRICAEDTATIVLLPCGHRAACVNCALTLETCPVCRTVIRI